MKTLGTKLMMLFFFICSASFAQIDFENYDTNTDGMTDQEEFLTGSETDFTNWDTDGDGSINDQEFYDTTFNRLDEDRDMNLSEEEWNNGYNHVFGKHMQGEMNRNEKATENAANKDNQGKGQMKGNHGYSKYDMDRDGMVSSAEFYNGMTNSYYYSTYDTNQDGAVDSNELYSTTFMNMDENQDGNLDQNEYETYSGYYID